MDAISDPDIHTIVVMSSAQVGKTEILLNAIGYYAHQDPSPMLLLQPTLEMAETFSKDRLAPMVRDTPVLTDKFAPARSKNSGNTLRHKTFTGGHITMSGANSPASLASRPIRIVLADEVDRYPVTAGTEGDPVNLAKKRTTTFHNRKIILTSTPTVKDASRIETAFHEGDQRTYHIKCSHCDEYHEPKWKNVVWEDPRESSYSCPECGAIWTERDRIKAIMQGKWIAKEKCYGVASFHLSELISPWSTPSSMAIAFLQAKQGGAEMLKTWINTSLGETWEEDGEQADPTALINFTGNFDKQSVPERVQIITAGVDTQKDRLEVQLVGWENPGIPYILSHDIIWGDPNQQKVWNDLDDYLLGTYSGLKISQVFVDSGGLSTESVYRFTKKRQGRRVFSIKGDGGQKDPVSRPRQIGPLKVMLYRVGIDPLKRTLTGWLKNPGELIHFSHTLDEEFFLQLTAEKMMIRKVKGYPKVEFVKTRDRNEALDCFVYAYAAMLGLNVNWEKLEKSDKEETKVELEDVPVVEKKFNDFRQRNRGRHKKPSNYVTRF